MSAHESMEQADQAKEASGENKKIALLMSRTGPNTPFSLLQALLSAQTALLHGYQLLATEISD